MSLPKLAFLGPLGTYSHQVGIPVPFSNSLPLTFIPLQSASDKFGTNVDYIAKETIKGLSRSHSVVSTILR